MQAPMEQTKDTLKRVGDVERELTRIRQEMKDGVSHKETAIQDLQSLEMQIREVIDEQRRRNSLYLDAEAQEMESVWIAQERRHEACAAFSEE